MTRFHAPLALLALLAFPAAAETRALLVGVSDYAVLDADLKGPADDVRLMAGVLAARGVAPGAMVALTSDASGLDPAIATGQPTRAAILQAMAALETGAAPGDTVVFYFSGHGAEAPDLSGDEGGGYDEILLPADAAGWKGAIGAVENAIMDDELQDWAQGVLARGVKLVGLIDACHSATGFRAVGGAGVPRGLGAEALSIPAGVASAPPGPPAPPLTGEFVFLYSSQSDQRSFEYPLADGSGWHGEFTLRLAQILQAAPGASWAQVLAATSDAMVQGPARQVPDGEGPLLQAPVFGTGAVALRHAIKAGALSAGLLQGLAEGDTVAFFAAPAGGEMLGEAVLTGVEARSARLSGMVPQGALWAEVVAPAPPPPLRLAAPVQADGADYDRWKAALPEAAKGEVDLVPILTGGQVALAGPDGVLDPGGPGSTPRIALQGSETEAMAVERVLTAAGHSLRLRKLLAGLAGRSLTGKPALEAVYERRPGRDGGGQCTDFGPKEPVDPARGLQPCDQLWVTFTNVSGKVLDVSALYFNADFTISPVWPQAGLSNRLAPGESARAGLQILPGSTGFEELLLLAVPVGEDGTRADLTRLAEPAMTRSFASLSGPTENWIEDWMTGGSVTRGFSTRPAAVMMLRQPVRLGAGSALGEGQE